MKTLTLSAVALGLALALPALRDNARAATPAPASCESLAALTLPNVRITRAQTVPVGQFAGTPAGILAPGAAAFKPYSALPEFCRIAATLTPSADSDIKMELWMPAVNWNGKFLALGNGGWAGQLSIQAIANGMARGYAAAATDTGHSTPGGEFTFHHPEKLIDFAYRAVHEMTLQSKTIVRAFYGKQPAHSYWQGCSTGGRQGLKEAQRYPDDYDGIIAGAPANYMTHLMSHGIWIAQATNKEPGSLIPPAKYAVIHQAVMDACDALDGVKDGVLDDPRQCRFNPQTIKCAGDDAPSCLTAAQVETVRSIYAPVTNPASGAEIFPGLEPGSEMGWGGMAGPVPFPISTDYYKFVLFENPAWDFKTLAFDEAIAKSDTLDDRGATMNAIDPDLSAFIGRGGKLLMYHGWNDQLIAPRNTVTYYESIVRKLGEEKIADSVRLFMMPGANHCAGGDGPSNFDSLGAIESWVEQKQTPTRIVATHLANGAVDRSRPLCPYPQVAVHSGTGSTDEAAGFVCKKK